MSAYKYCEHCAGPLALPTIRQCVEKSRLCGWCNGENLVDQDDMITILELMDERITALEGQK